MLPNLCRVGFRNAQLLGVASHQNLPGGLLGRSDPTIWSAGADQQLALMTSGSLWFSPLLVLQWLSSVLLVNNISPLKKKDHHKNAFLSFSQPVHPVDTAEPLMTA